ncbi:MAG: exosortase/archaeosortase family protein [Planctomycetes bacterium]|nr:exosortase/archaeosortase family protein [Planctomycetota bacterium]
MTAGVGRALAATLAAVALLWSCREALASYLLDQHYQEHFLYLWVFLCLALAKTLRPPFRAGFDPGLGRDRLGLAIVAAGWLSYAISQAVGSSAIERTSLVIGITGVGVLAVPGWTVRRCLQHGALMLLCFGLPYSVYFPLTARMQWGVAQCIALPARFGWVDYIVDGPVVQFPGYQLSITPDCSGLGQLLTFLGIAALGILGGVGSWRRSAVLLAAAVLLAWVSNVARVALFVALIACGWTASVNDPNWHAALGFLVFLPFVTLLIGLVLRTHVALPSPAPTAVPAGRWPIAILVLPVLAAHLYYTGLAEPEFPAPDHFARIEQPPGHHLEQRAPSEADDRVSYGTRWLVNARFRAADGSSFDLFHYATRSRSHLSVHKIAACLGVEDRRVRYEPPVRIDGRSWWPIGLDHDDPSRAAHVYFAFEVGGRRLDDSPATQFAVFWQRLTGGSWEVRLTRVMLPGALPATPTEHERRVLGWLAGLTDAEG